MKDEYIQNLRSKLQNRIKNIHNADTKLFHLSLQHFIDFINNQPVLLGILDDLVRLYPDISEDTIAEIRYKDGIFFDTGTQTACFAYHVLNCCAKSKDTDIENSFGFCYVKKIKIFENLNAFYNLFINPVYEYLDEHLDDQRMMLVILQRYKQKCEWFQRDSLFQKWESDTQKGEKGLARHLYEYLHDQGLVFSIEPSSVSGEADLVSAQNSEDPLVADVKIFCPEKSKGKTYIIKGFRQVYQYTLDYNEPFGYLIIFNTSGQDIKFSLSNKSKTIPSVIHNNKTIFLIVVDIFPYKETASKRGVLSAIEIFEDEIIRRIQEPMEQ